MVQAGEAVDATIEGLKPHLDKGDIIIDAGNADFNDTRRREAALRDEGLRFIGMGVSGGEEGARHGPSIMVGGEDGAYAEIAEIVTAIAARYQDAPCAAHLGANGAGHFVKTVHNGIEYADMQMIAEIFGLLHDGEGRSAAKIADLFEDWNGGPLQSYLVEITDKVLRATDPETGKPMVDVILDRAGQKGTGRWTVIEALKLGQSASTIEAAVGARSWSAASDLRVTGSERLSAPDSDRDGARRCWIPIWKRRCWRPGSSPIPRASRCSRQPRPSSTGLSIWPASPKSGAPAASSGRPCSMTSPPRSGATCLATA